MSINEDSVLSAISMIKDNVLDTGYTDSEKLIVLCNILLDVSKNHLPFELSNDADKLLSNGKRVSFELNENPENVGLFIAYKTHLLLSMVERLND